MNISLSFENPSRGHAFLCSATSETTIFLPTLTSLLKIPRRYFPFNTIEQLLVELTIHEVLHQITGIREDYLIDAWHMLLCRSRNGRVECDCPIDCFFRDSLVKWERGQSSGQAMMSAQSNANYTTYAYSQRKSKGILEQEAKLESVWKNLKYHIQQSLTHT